MSKATHSFRSGKSQAKRLISELAAHGTSRHAAKETGAVGIQIIGTERSCRQVLDGFTRELQREHRGDLWNHSREAAVDYLTRRAELVSQPTLNLDRQALDRLERHLHGPDVTPLPKVKSTVEITREGRAYSAPQLAALMSFQSEKHQLSTEIAIKAGLRAHELYSLRRVSEAPRSSHREWNGDRFKGVTGTRPDGALYTVKGKGGLIREVWIPGADLVARLEACRLPQPEKVIDRGIFYQRVYELPGGQKWSQSFSTASTRALGWSHGAHGTRWTYAQGRIDTLLRAGLSYHAAKLALSQELGHFSASKSDPYLAR